MVSSATSAKSRAGLREETRDPEGEGNSIENFNLPWQEIRRKRKGSRKESGRGFHSLRHFGKKGPPSDLERAKNLKEKNGALGTTLILL